MQSLNFEDPEFVRRYTEGPGQFVPGYTVMQRMAAQLIAERIGQSGSVLVLGAGGGLEIEHFARLQPGWTFLGVDPAEEMLASAKSRMRTAGLDARVEWVRGLIFQAPSGPFDAATALLTLHFVPDDGSKLDTLKALRARLRRGAPLIIVDLCIDKGSANLHTELNRYRDFALASGAEPADVADTCARILDVMHPVKPERVVQLLAQSGFSDVELFYAGLSWRGSIARA
jgi:tRNA (cmo5U34)-methyltransferase